MSEVPNPYFINIELFWPDGTRPNQNQIARVNAFDVHESTVTIEGQSGFDSGTGGWQPIFMQNIAAFFPPRTRPNLRFQVVSTQEQVVHVTQVFSAIPSGSTVRIVIGVSDELVGGGGGPGGTFRVSGRVRRTDGTPITAGTVRAFDVTNDLEAQLGTSPIAADGSYTITYTADAFNQNGEPHSEPNLVVRAYDASMMLLAESERHENAPSDAVIDLTVLIGPEPGKRRVFGTVTNTIGLPVSEIEVAARHVAWTDEGIQEIELGSPVDSDSAGNYEILYDVPTVEDPNACATPPDQINLIVYAREAGITLSNSGLIFNAAPEQRADLVVDRVSKFDDSEYKRLHEHLSPCFGGEEPVRWDTLNDLRDRPEYVEFAAKASGQPVELVLAYVQAWLIAGRISAEVGAPPLQRLELPEPSPEVIYGLVRTGLGDDLRKLLDVTPDGFFESTLEAIRRGIISPDIEELLSPSTPSGTDSLLDDWKLVISTLLASGTLEDGQGEIWQQLLLELVFPGSDQASVDKRKLIVGANVDNLGEFDALIDDLLETEDIDDTEAENLRFVFEMYDAVNRWYPIVAAVYNDKVNHPTWHTIAQLAEVPVGASGVDPSWFKYITDSFSHVSAVGGALLPADIPGGSIQTTSTERIQVYAQRLFDLFGGVSPEDRFTKTLADSATGNPSLQGASDYITDNPDFSLETSNVDNYLDEHPPDPPLDEPELEQLKQQLKQLQRVFRLTNDFAAAVALIEAGLDSAVKIARFEEGAFIAVYAELLGGVTAARDIHRLAVHYSSEVLFTLAKFHQNLTDVGGVVAVPGPVNFRVLDPTSEFDPDLIQTPPGEVSIRPTRRFPNWITLFGDVNKCACQHCQTVLSPGAYMVDLLEFIDGAPKKTLFARRPDLMDLEITCPNTDKSLPYIDLVNEVLEAVVAPLEFTIPSTLSNSLYVASTGDGPALAAVREAIETKGGAIVAPQARAYKLTEHFVVKIGPLDQRPERPLFREWVVEDDGWRFTLHWAEDTNPAGPIGVIPSPQTSPTSESLEVFPEHFNVAAYETLQTAVFPFNLPLALGREELAIFLQVKNAPQHEILEAFTTEDLLQRIKQPDDALAYLGLTAEEATALLGTTAGKNPWDYWGFTLTTGTEPVTLPRPDKPTVQITVQTDTEADPEVPAWVRALSLVPVFLHRTGLDYQELLDLLDTEFVHVEAADLEHGLHIVASNDDLVECNYNDFQIVHLNAASLRRISVFVRLWRKLGWSMREVDRYLMQIEGGQIPTSLVTLARIKRLIDELRQKPLTVFAWWSGIDRRRTTRVPKSLFDEVFLVGPSNQPEIQSFERIAQGETVNPGDLAPGEDLRSHVRAALRLRADDIELLWDDFVGAGGVSATQVSGMYRVATFAGALRLSVEELYDAILLTGTDPFSITVTNPSEVDAALDATYGAIRELRRWQATRMSADELRYLLADAAVAGDPFVPTGDDFEQAALRLASSVAELTAAVPDSPTIDATLLTTQLSKVMPADKVVRALEIVATATGTDLDAGTTDREFLERYFGPFLPADPAPLFTAIVNALRGPEPYVPTRFELIWGTTPSRAVLGPIPPSDPANPPPPPNPPQVVQDGFGPALFAHLFEQARADAALTAATEIVGLARDTTDRLLTDVLSSVEDTAMPPTVPAAEDWKEFLNGGWDTGEPILVGAPPTPPTAPRTALLLVPRGGTYRLVAQISAANAPATDVSLTIDGVPIDPEGAPKQLENPTRTEITFLPQTLRASSAVEITFGYTGTATVTLLWRIDNADAVIVPQSALLPFRRDAYLKLFKAGRVISGLKLDKAELRYLVEAGDLAFDLDRLPVRTDPDDPAVPWSDLATFLDRLALSRGVSLKDRSLFEFLADDADTATVEDVAGLTGWKADDIETVRGLFGTPPGFADPALWFVLQNAFRIVRRLDLRAQQIQELLIGSAPSIAIATTVRNIFRAQFSQDAWKDVFKPLRDKLRQRQRDALVAYLTSRAVPFAGNLQTYFIDSNELYSQLLIDTQMEPDTLISRIRLALNVIQLFVDRVFLGLEDQASLIELDQAKQQWVWMNRYRVWEANRKVFLYPENFIEPELRDDKTEFFTELEQELLEGEVTHERGVAALTNYLDKMNEVSNLEIVGAFADVINSGGTSIILHVVGRTRSRSRAHYYRTFIGKQFHQGNWTPWRKISLEINADTVAPIVFQGRLHLVWPSIQMKQKPNPVPAGSTVTEQGAGDVRSTVINEIRLMWSELNPTSNKWSKPRVSKSTAVDSEAATPFTSDAGQDQPSTDPYHLRLEASSSDFLSVTLIKTNVPATDGPTSPKALGTFKLWYTDDDSFETSGAALSLGINRPVGAIIKHNSAEEVGYAVDNVFSKDVLSFDGGTVFFGKTPDTFRIVPTNFGFLHPAEYRPFFYETTRGSLFAINHGLVTEPSLGNQQVQRASFSTFHHPLVREFQKALAFYGPEGIMNRLEQALPVADNRYYNNYYYNYYGHLYLGYHIAGDNQAWWTSQRIFQANHQPGPKTVFSPFPLPTVEFGYGASFGIYNWELFFHLPMLVANLLSQNLRFEDSMKWYHYVFDPRRDLENYEKTKRFVQSLPTGSRYWNFLPFFANKDATDSLAVTLGLKENLSTYDQQQLSALIDEWRNNPFNPHLIARQRIAAYQKNVVMKYLDNLIAWADSLFRQDTFETINLATQLYVLADEILGRRPELIEPLTGEPKYTFRELQARGLDDFSNAIVEVENLLATTKSYAKETTVSPASAAMANLSRLTVKTFYFAIPRNDRLDRYWDTVQDRLFKIRNSMNIDGVKRQLALFEPPIDPALLVRAAAAGLDLGSVLAQLNAPLPCYRFAVWVHKATELVNELKSFGAQFLAALEKKDGEALQLLRQTHEIRLLKLVRQIRERQITEAEENIKALELSRALAEERRNFFSSREKISTGENVQLITTGAASVLEVAQGVTHLLAAIFAPVPDANAGMVGPFPLLVAAIKAGTAGDRAATSAAHALGAAASAARGVAAVAGLLAGYERRWDDWKFQERLANKEIEQINQQILVANIRLDIAQKELDNHDVQVEQSEEMLTFLQDKFTSRELYEWMSRELSKTYKKVYQLAFDAAKAAERTYQFELGRDESFIRYDYVDSLRQGLLSGERLMYDLKRLDVAYLEHNKRDLELQKPISLAQLNADALQELRETGACTFELPEILFDLDFPGQYFRRIKAVRLTIPCVTGPYTSVSAKLTLLGSAIRKDSAADPEDYPYKGFDDPRFVHDPIGIQSIATSTAQNDPGLFELNFRDERYLPFEGAGAISRWRLELPTAARQFDYNTISDVVMQLSYMARDAGGTLRVGAEQSIERALNSMLQAVVASPENATGLVRVMSLRQEFPDVLHRLLASPGTPVELTLRPEHFPFLLRSTTPRATISVYNDPDAPAGSDPNPVDVHAIVKADADPEGAFGTPATISLNPPDPLPSPPHASIGDFAVGANPRIATTTVSKGDDAALLGGDAWTPETWTLSQTGLAADRIDDVILVLKYVVDLPEP